MTVELPNELITYLAEQDGRRRNAVARTLAALSPREQRLVREAAVMGYVRGDLARKCRETRIPRDSDIVAEVVDACLALPGRFPMFNAVNNEQETNHG